MSAKEDNTVLMSSSSAFKASGKLHRALFYPAQRDLYFTAG